MIHAQASITARCFVCRADHLKSTVRNILNRCERTVIITYHGLAKQPSNTKERENESFILCNEYKSPSVQAEASETIKQGTAFTSGTMERAQKYSVIEVK